MSDYMQDVVSDAFEFLKYNQIAIREVIAEDTGELSAVLNGGIYDRFCEDLHSRTYSWMEAATIIEDCKREEDDASLWFGRKMEDAVQVCAVFSYANDVWDVAIELYEELFDKYEVSYDVITPEGAVLESCEDELDAEDYIDEHEDEICLEVKEINNLDEIWKDFIEEHEDEAAKPVYVFDGIAHELVKIVEEGGEYLVYRLKYVQVTASGMVFTFEDQPQIWNYKPYEDADVSTDPAVYFHDVKTWSNHKVRF